MGKPVASSSPPPPHLLEPQCETDLPAAPNGSEANTLKANREGKRPATATPARRGGRAQGPVPLPGRHGPGGRWPLGQG